MSFIEALGEASLLHLSLRVVGTVAAVSGFLALMYWLGGVWP